MVRNKSSKDGGNRKGGNDKKSGIFKIKPFAKKPTPVFAYERLIITCNKQILEIKHKLGRERNPSQKINLSIELCAITINKANSQKELFQWFLKNPNALAILGLTTTRKKLLQEIRKMNRIVAKEEKKANDWRKRKKISLKK